MARDWTPTELAMMMRQGVRAPDQMYMLPGSAPLGFADRNVNVNVQQAQPAAAPAGAATPMTDEEKGLVNQGAWAGAGAAAAEAAGDWHNSAAQTLAKALAGYNAGAYRSQQDLENRRLQREQLDSIKDERALRRSQIEAAIRDKAQQDAFIATLPPEQQAAYRLYGAQSASSFLPVGPAEQAKLDIMQQGQDSENAYRNAQLGISRGELDLKRKLAGSQQAPTPELQAIDDPEHPGQAIYIDKRTGQPYMVGGQVARPASQREQGGGFTQEAKLREQWDKTAQPMRNVVTSYQKLDSALGQKNGAGDLAAIFAFMKSLDPDSVVREGEQDQARATGGAADWLVGYAQKLQGGGSLTPDVRDQLRGAAMTQVQALRPEYDTQRKFYETTAGTYGLNPANVLTPVNWPEARPNPDNLAAAPAPATPASGGIVPSANAAEPGKAAPAIDYDKLMREELLGGP